VDRIREVPLGGPHGQRKSSEFMERTIMVKEIVKFSFKLHFESVRKKEEEWYKI
jgi:hypothetical protein